MAKKILLINTTFTTGGAASVARALFESSNALDTDIYFAYGRGHQSHVLKTFKFGNFFETILHASLVRLFGIEGVGSYFSTKKLIRYIQKGNFDLIHLHNLHGYYLNFGLLVKFLNESGLRVIWTLHDEWPLTWLPAHSMGCLHCKSGVGRCVNSYSYPKTYNKLFPRLLLKRKQKIFLGFKNLKIISPAVWLQNELNKSYLKDFTNSVIHNGVDTNLFKPTENKSGLREKYGLPKDKKIILFGVANLNNKNKGVRSILQAAGLLADKNYLFLGMGKGTLPRRSNVKAFGHIADKSVLADIYNASDLFCMASKSETQSLAVLESLSAGLPVVAYRILALTEIINDEVGTLVPFQNASVFSSEIIANLGEEILSRKSQKARALAVDKFSQESFLKNYSNLYQEN